VNGSRRVLVIGGVSDTETVLKAVLEPRGATVERSRTQPQLVRSSTGRSPQVVVIDIDTELDAKAAAVRWHQSQRVLIGSDLPGAIAADERFLAKPFHYPELVKVIEELLNERPAA
jgi:CheY-like chemotaxis protein